MVPGLSFFTIFIYDPAVVIVNIVTAAQSCQFTSCFSNPLAFFHEFDNDHRGAHLAEDHDDQEHHEATQLLVDQVEREHAVYESARQEDKAE